ncbi:hypothetical protein WICPIJ_000203 [Wickerhamomyces pijperi]|uniref:Uncharacterized protein n=1 Tax=Wickerhamomyces pijperi TaxID=599730 RepID=A0A9P8TSC1_WICPI|nr:hypothetical protein WICPIJ_000203 [Wickerhamomyces pijperi]
MKDPMLTICPVKPSTTGAVLLFCLTKFPFMLTPSPCSFKERITVEVNLYSALAPETSHSKTWILSQESSSFVFFNNTTPENPDSSLSSSFQR